MQKRILVPLDGSALADRILTLARRLLVRRDYEVELLTVLDDGADRSGADVATAHLEGARAALVAQGATATVRVAIGDPVTQILEAARDEAVELVVMATHGRTGLDRVLRGSVAEQVLRRCDAPVLTANPRALEHEASELPLRSILVALDLSNEALTVMPLVVDLARLYDAEVVLLTVEAIPPVAGPGEGAPVRVPAQVEAALEEDVQRLRTRGLRARSVISYGPVGATILDIVRREQPGLVAMTTHGRHGIARAVLGSTAEEVLRECSVPLLIQRVSRGGVGARRARTGRA